MHREIMNVLNDSREIDHKDGNGLNNQRSNLRIATRSQNAMNIGTKSDNTSGYKGVSWRIDHKKWQVQIKVNGKTIHFGYYNNKVVVVKVYNEATIKYHKKFANINKI